MIPRTTLTRKNSPKSDIVNVIPSFHSSVLVLLLVEPFSVLRPFPVAFLAILSVVVTEILLLLLDFLRLQFFLTIFILRLPKADEMNATPSYYYYTILKLQLYLL